MAKIVSLYTPCSAVFRTKEVLAGCLGYSPPGRIWVIANIFVPPVKCEPTAEMHLQVDESIVFRAPLKYLMDVYPDAKRVLSKDVLQKFANDEYQVTRKVLKVLETTNPPSATLFAYLVDIDKLRTSILGVVSAAGVLSGPFSPIVVLKRQHVQIIMLGNDNRPFPEMYFLCYTIRSDVQ